MPDITDQATEREQQLRDEALALRKPVPAKCEHCEKPVATLSNGTRSRFCKAHLAEYVQELAGDLGAL